jgi:5'-3' exoribonuclease 1
MGQWEQEIFEKEYADMNWYKGKQMKHVNEMEMGRKRARLGSSPIFPWILSSTLMFQIFLSVLTQPQRDIFDKVKAFVLDNRTKSSAEYRCALLSMPNTFAARERKFISTLAEDLHLSVTWDDYDGNDQNIVTWRFPGALEQQLPEPEEVDRTNCDVEGEGEWEDVDDDDEEEEEEEEEESKAAVDRVLKKYSKAQVMDDDEGGGFDARYERSLREKMDEWKRSYYKVHFFTSHVCVY